MGIKGAVIFGIFLEIFLGAAAAAFYFMYYIHTPTYSINALQRAIQSNNVDDFQRYVDLDAILQKGAADLAGLDSVDAEMKKKLQDGSFVKLCRDDILYSISNGDWKEVKEITPEIEFQDNIGLRTMSIRRIEYVVKDKPFKLQIPFLNDATEENQEQEEPDDGVVKATIGVLVYEPNLGDSFLIKLKMRQMEDQSWQVYDVLNYGEFAEAIMKQNARDYKRYVDKVRTNIKNTEDKFAALKKKIPEINKEWIIESQKIMKESCEQLDELKVPVAGAKLDNLLNARKSIFYDMMDMYYESLNFKETVADYQKSAEEAAKAAAEKGQKQKQKRKPNFDKQAAKIDEKLAEANKNWETNKSELAKILGPLSRNATEARGLRALRNNDDYAVRQANYPGVENANTSEGVNPLRPETLPEVSAFSARPQI